MQAYDKDLDYSDLIAREAAKGVNADRALLAQYEAARNAKIAGEGLDYAQTNVYTREVSEPRHYYTATDKSDYIRELYAASERQALEALEGAYAEELAASESEAAALPGAYREAANRTAAAGETALRSMNERFAASGLNSGARGQAALTLGMIVQGELAALESERASKLAELAAQRARLRSDYRRAVAEAILQNETELARALYEEAVRVDESYAVADAELLEEVYSSSRGQGYTGYTPAGGGSSAPESEPAASETSGGTQTVLSSYDKLAAQLAAAGDSARRSSLISAALSAGRISSAEAARLRSQYGLGAVSASRPVSGGGGGRVTAATK